MWLISIEAVPDPKKDPKAAKESDGAFVNCWIDFLLEDGAVELAKFYIRQQGWTFVEFADENLWFNEEDCEDDEQKQYFVEAEECGITMVWYYYPIEDEEDFEDEGLTESSNINTTGH